jgi:hypothetical protein
MNANIILIIPDKKELAALTAKLQPDYAITIAESMESIKQLMEEKDIQLIVCTKEFFAQSANAPKLHRILCSLGKAFIKQYNLTPVEYQRNCAIRQAADGTAVIS